MDYLSLGKSGLKVSRICLGTMTWGEQNTETEAHGQLDYALAEGINFIDTAEMYPVPARPDTYGLTEKYIGNWIEKRKNRDKFILASKACGPGPKWIRNNPAFDKKQLTDALEGSLSRLKTDYIDLYQLHWPERSTNFFGKLGYNHPKEDKWDDNILEILRVLSDFIKAGKIRHIGLSNETPWGTMHFLHLAKQNKLPEIVSVQNPYSLLNRTYEIGLAEISHRESIGLLAYSPLAFGVLSGKYYNGNTPENARLIKFKDKLPRYNGELSRKASNLYTDLANESGISPAQLALAFVNSRSFLASNIIGATTMDQLKENIDSINVNLSPETLKKIEEIHLKIPNPAP
jgi:aryl-alcohol dehydrogenase-like predicted oxidoreductase